MTPMTPTKTAAQPPAKSPWDGPAKAKGLRRSVRPSAEMGIDGELRGAMMATRTQPMGAMRVPSSRAGRAAKQMSTAARDAKPFVAIRAPTEQKHATMVSMLKVFQKAEMAVQRTAPSSLAGPANKVMRPKSLGKMSLV